MKTSSCFDSGPPSGAKLSSFDINAHFPTPCMITFYVGGACKEDFGETVGFNLFFAFTSFIADEFFLAYAA